MSKKSTSIYTLVLLAIILLFVSNCEINSSIINENELPIIQSSSSSLNDSNSKNSLAIENGIRMKNKRPSSYNEYLELREKFIQTEQSKSIGSDIMLNEREKLANKIIMLAKNDEISKGFLNSSLFTPSKHIFDVLNQIKSSKLFKLIKRMPKGAVLHAHDTSLCSTDYLISITYEPYLWQCYDNKMDILNLKFSLYKPLQNEKINNCEWILVSEERNRQGEKFFNKNLRKHFSLYTRYPLEEYKDINNVWNKFMKIFSTITPMLTYVPVWKNYYKRALQEFYEDNVQYLEFRGTLPTLYDLDGNNYTNADTLQIYLDALNEFKEENPGFYGSKFIYGPNRKCSNNIFESYMKTLVDLKNKFPNFLAGFDLVSQEDKGRPLIDFASYLLKLPENIDFYFHAGETNWYGTSTDQNLIDAILLGTKRIGHGYAILKHPDVLKYVKNNGIAIEINPISNQVLKLNMDNRNHPCSYLFANNYPVVISSDDPSLWETTPLSHDFYIAFLGMSSAHSDLRTLKQLAINSIMYSSLNLHEKKIFLNEWKKSYYEYIEWIINSEYKSYCYDENNDVKMNYSYDECLRKND